jgi:hypothetical protein
MAQGGQQAESRVLGPGAGTQVIVEDLAGAREGGGTSRVDDHSIKDDLLVVESTVKSNLIHINGKLDVPQPHPGVGRALGLLD